MRKPIFLTLIATSLIFSGCGRTQQPTQNTEQPSVSAVDRSLVTLYFRGLMVFHKETGGGRDGYYEVGILPAVKHDHDFKFFVNDEDLTTYLDPKRHWTFEVTGSTGSLILPEPKGHNQTRPDKEQGVRGFDWLIELDGPQFHDGDLEVKKDVLKPIFHLPNGKLYTEYKSIDLIRCQGDGGCAKQDNPRSDFGFMSETIAMDLELKSGQELILKSDSGQRSILKFSPGRGRQTVEIWNVRPKPTEESDFNLYYKLLFTKVSADQQYDFERKTGDRYFPYNPRPRPQPPLSKTCCQMDCTAVLLGRGGNLP